jgi:hypothetical protein
LKVRGVAEEWWNLGRGLRRPWRVREAEAREEGFGEVYGEDEREEEREKKIKKNKKIK